MSKLPYPFIVRRLHSLLGIWLAVYLFEHLLINSQVALFAQDQGHGFVHMVNKIHALPYLKVIEVLVLGLPFLLHGVWGIFYAKQARLNDRKTDGTKPALKYKRNRSFTWQRITSWILLVGILGHVVQMRFVDYPEVSYAGQTKSYSVKLNSSMTSKAEAIDAHIQSEGKKIIVTVPTAGAAFLLIVLEIFQNPLFVILYTLLVIAAAYHAFNGVWTFCITWGLTLTQISQKRMRVITNVMMGVVMLLGLMAVWGPFLL